MRIYKNKVPTWPFKISFTSYTIEHILVVLELFMTLSEHYHYSAQLALLEKFKKHHTFRGIEISHI